LVDIPSVTASLASQDVPAILRLVSKGLIDITTPISRRYALQDAGTALIVMMWLVECSM